MDIEFFLEKLKRKKNLLASEAHKLANTLTLESLELEKKKMLLSALSDKGETAVEIIAFAKTFVHLARDPGLGAAAKDAIDVCGTGGDHSNSFNISTAVAFVLAAGGVPVVKHGNRSVTSKCGSADFLQALGFKIEVPPAKMKASLDTINFYFLFAPAFHPVFRNVIPVRKALAAEGRTTIFNLLGPLLNPARPSFQLMGIFSPKWVPVMAEALSTLGVKRGLVVHCQLDENKGLDEWTCAGKNTFASVGELSSIKNLNVFEKWGLSPCSLSDLAGGDIETNCQILEAVFAGQGPTGLRDTICLNAGAAFWVSGKVSNLGQGIAQAKTIIDTGIASNWLKKTRTFYAS